VRPPLGPTLRIPSPLTIARARPPGPTPLRLSPLTSPPRDDSFSYLTLRRRQAAGQPIDTRGRTWRACLMAPSWLARTPAPNTRSASVRRAAAPCRRVLESNCRLPYFFLRRGPPRAWPAYEDHRPQGPHRRCVQEEGIEEPPTAGIQGAAIGAVGSLLRGVGGRCRWCRLGADYRRRVFGGREGNSVLCWGAWWASPPSD